MLALACSRGARPAPNAGIARAPSAHVADAPPPIRFIEDDYARALSEARGRGVPLLVDAWAPWCHTCLSMRAFVFTDDRLRPLASRYVWLSVDTEREQNSALVNRLGVKVLPTLFVIEPREERVALEWPGSLEAAELATLLDDTRSGAGPRGPLAIDAEVTRASREGRLSACVATAASEAPRLPPGTALADVIRTGIDCAESLPPEAPARSALAALAELGERVAADPSQPILADDRSDLYDYVIAAYRALGRKTDTSRLAAAWAAFLEDQAAHAPTAPARAVFDAHRVLAYTAIDQVQKAVPMLDQSEREFPDDYNPPARLAQVYLSMKQFDDALRAVKRALDRAYGPRKLRLWSLQADIHVAQGDVDGARRALRAAVEFARTVPLTGGYPRQLEAIEKRLAELR